MIDWLVKENRQIFGKEKEKDEGKEKEKEKENEREKIGKRKNRNGIFVASSPKRN